MPTCLVVGAQGVLGALTAEVFRNEGWTVLRGGRRPDGEPDFRLVDLDRPETIAQACAGVDIVINSVEDPHCRAERHVLESGGTILNMATVQLASRERLRASVADPKGRVLFGAGYSGLTAIVAKGLLSRNPEADTLDSAYTMSLSAMSGREGALFGHRLLAGGSRRQTRRFDFGPPMGSLTCLEIDMREEGWFDPTVLGSRKSRLYITLAERGLFSMMRLLDRLGLLARLPGSWVRPRPPKSARVEDATVEPMMAWLGVSRDGLLIDETTISTHGDYLTTAHLALQMSNLMAAGPLTPGVFTADTWFNWPEFAPTAAAIGVKVS